MKRDGAPTALERLIEPLPGDLKAAVLEAWKNEDIPHDENDSVYRLMNLLVLHARFYQKISMTIVAAANKIHHAYTAHLEQTQSALAAHRVHFQDFAREMKAINGALAEVRRALDEKPKSLRSQLESEMRSIFYDLRKEGQEIIREFSTYTSRFKNDCEEWRAQAYFTYLLVGVIAGIAITLTVLTLIPSHAS